MKRVLRLFLILGALIGLFSQAVAYASVVPAVSAPMTMSGMSDSRMSENCGKMMAKPQQPAPKPCQGMTLACIAAMGCVVPMVVHNDATALAARAADPSLAFWPTTTVLLGSDLAPEPEPPTLLG
ncbi:MAG: hypothetical protein ABIT04_09575 [Novosphingobium sp.]